MQHLAIIIIITFIYTAKIDQLNLNIKTAGINLCAVDKIFQISVSDKKRLLETKR